MCRKTITVGSGRAKGVRHRDHIDTHRAVIRRLLDGWEPDTGDMCWHRGGSGDMTRFERYRSEPMSEHEAHTIRLARETAPSLCSWPDCVLTASDDDRCIAHRRED